jgi:hypothetical protein
MSQFTCPCGFRVDGYAREAWAAYRQHGCQHHQAEPVDPDDVDTSSGMSWPGVLGLVAVLLFLSFICTHGWGHFG